MKNKIFSHKASLCLLFGLASAIYAADPCKDAMGHTGSGTTVTNSQTGSINGTPWGYEIWYDGGNNSMTYYNNGTFSAK